MDFPRTRRTGSPCYHLNTDLGEPLLRNFFPFRFCPPWSVPLKILPSGSSFKGYTRHFRNSEAVWSADPHSVWGPSLSLLPHFFFVSLHYPFPSSPKLWDYEDSLPRSDGPAPSSLSSADLRLPSSPPLFLFQTSPSFPPFEVPLTFPGGRGPGVIFFSFPSSVPLPPLPARFFFVCFVLFSRGFFLPDVHKVFRHPPPTTLPLYSFLRLSPFPFVSASVRRLPPFT